MAENLRADNKEKEEDRPTSSFADIEEMNLEDHDVSDRRLQHIFEHMTGLKKLHLRFGPGNTNFGLTGRHGSRPGVNKDRQSMMSQFRRMFGDEHMDKIYGKTTDEPSEPSKGGFSISRLQNLEHLVMVASNISQMDDTIYDEFVFPKLRTLEFSPPDDSSLLPQMALFMPSLEVVRFIWQPNNYRDLVRFCGNLKKLQKLYLRKTSLGSDMSMDEIQEAFEVCPTLTEIEGYSEFAYYNRSTRKLEFKKLSYSSDEDESTEKLESKEPSDPADADESTKKLENEEPSDPAAADESTKKLESRKRPHPPDMDDKI